MKLKKTKKQKFMVRIFLSGLLLLAAGFVIIAYPSYVYSGDFGNQATLEKKREVKVDEKISITFSVPVKTDSIEKSFEISPKQEVYFIWQDKNQKLLVAPKQAWLPQTTYQLNIKNGRNIVFGKIEKKMEFRTEDYPKLISIFPQKGEKNVAVSMEEPVTANFNKSLNDYNVKFVVNPEEALEYQMNEEKTQIKLLAKSDFEWQTDYGIEVFVKSKWQSAAEYAKLGQTNFQTEDDPTPIQWDKNFDVRLAQAAELVRAQIKTGKYIDINLTQQVMVIFENGKSLNSYMISSGKRGMDTPVGNFKIENKAARAWSKKYGLFMPNWMAFLPSGEMGIHALPVWPSGYQEGANHLGIPVSHGCVRLGPAAARRVYDWAELGTPVVIHR